MVELKVMDSSKWQGKADAVFTNPYAPLPKCVHGLPSIISLAHRDRKDLMERIVRTEGWLGGAKLLFLSQWGLGGHNSMFVANMPKREVDLSELTESHFPYVEGVGWFPITMCLQMLHLYSDIITPPMVVWDGFCGRGSVAKACSLLGLGNVSIDIDPERVEMARVYLGST